MGKRLNTKTKGCITEAQENTAISEKKDWIASLRSQ